MKRVFTRRYRAFAQLLKRARQAAGLTQKDMAQRFQTEQTTVSKIERGHRRLDALEFVDWCRIVRADPCRILRQVPRPRER